MAIRLLLVDDHRLILEGIASYLEDDNNLELVGGASNGIEALDLLKTSQVDLALVDISMPHMDGIELTKRMTSEYPETKIICLSMFNDNMNIKKMMNAGAKGYVLKNCSQDELKKAINTIVGGETYYSPEVTETVMNALMKKKVTSEFQIVLTDREVEVLQLIVQECSNQEISDKLFISARTVDAHKRNLLEKTGAKNVAGLVVFAINHNLVEDL
jgi:DNA-binding NarL/FixJ family response regulator